jgi:hypothetical protein
VAYAGCGKHKEGKYAIVLNERRETKTEAVIFLGTKEKQQL